ncbi:MAG: RnfABCDGE type electron transport complex subunit B [Comamonadaceae bacterium]|nr:MAG: RnfABCDGE type electron transport complex subunit B [Comamonadaceae bacterium]
MTPLAARLHAALPQTQCTRCGYPDCAGYAQAMAAGEAGINQCPPGGARGIVRLAGITGRPPPALNPDNGVEGPRHMAVIDEAWCIGCTLCLDACPTDAILGGNKRMHTVIEPYCTGWNAWSQAQADEALARYEQRQARKLRAAAEHVDRMEQKAKAKLADLPALTHGAEGAELSRKKAVIEAALARARAKRDAA